MTPTSDLLIPVSARDHRQGSETAPLTLVEYGDYQCPYCGEAYAIIKEAQRELGTDLQFVFRNFPLTQTHPNAELAAEAAEAAGAMGKFWPMHDALYENQRSLGRDFVLSLADTLGFDRERLAVALKKRRYRAQVREEFMGGVRSGVNGTPGFFINGQRYQQAWDLESLLRALRAAHPRRQAG